MGFTDLLSMILKKEKSDIEIYYEERNMGSSNSEVFGETGFRMTV